MRCVSYRNIFLSPESGGCVMVDGECIHKKNQYVAGGLKETQTLSSVKLPADLCDVKPV